MKKNLLLIGLFFRLTATHAQNAPENRYAGIEIGSTGVKFTIIDSKPMPEKIDNINYFSYEKVEEESDNTRHDGFTNETRNTILAIEQFYKKAKVNYGLPNPRIFICVSRGVVSMALKRDGVSDISNSPTLNNLKTRILERLPNYNGQLHFLSEHEELELMHIGLIPEATRTEVALLDIGSGTTKGGHFIDAPQKRFVPFEIVEGTHSLSNLAKKNLTPSQFDCCYISKVKVMIDSQLSEIRLSIAGIRSQSKLVLTGGICWAVARILNPNDTKDMQRITIDDVNQVRSIVSNRETFKNLAVQSKLPENKELKRVLDVFNQDMLISGSMLLHQLLEEIKGRSNDTHFYVYKASYAGWLKSYIIASVSGGDSYFKSICR